MSHQPSEPTSNSASEPAVRNEPLDPAEQHLSEQLLQLVRATEQLLKQVLAELPARLQDALCEALAKAPLLTDDRTQFSTKEAARELGLREWTVREYCNQGRIRGVKLDNGRWRITRAELVRYREQGPPDEYVEHEVLPT